MTEKPWVMNYMTEISRKKRRQILNDAIEAEGMSPENELRSRLYEARFGLNEKSETDVFIRGWMTLYNLPNLAKGLFGKKRMRKNLDSVAADWKTEMAASYGSIGDEVLYQELFHMVMVYIHLCMTDRNYYSVVFGMGRMQDSTLTAKIAGDVFRVAVDIPQQYGCEQEFPLLARAAEDAFSTAFPDDTDIYMNLKKKRKTHGAR